MAGLEDQFTGVEHRDDLSNRQASANLIAMHRSQDDEAWARPA
jgi:hypothetical protein